MIDGMLLLMVREYGQLSHNDIETLAADLHWVGSHCVLFPAACQLRHTYRATLGFIPLGGGVKTQ